MKGSVKEPNMFHNYETEKITLKASDATENLWFLELFRLDALALSVIATATWLAGWVAVCHSRYCIKTTKRI